VNSECLILESERNTRNQWLLFTFIIAIAIPLMLFVMTAIISQFEYVSQKELLSPIVHIVLGIISFGPSWYFTYKKCGIKLLTLNLILFLFIGLIFIGALWDSGLTLGIAINTVVCIWWFQLSLKVRKINKTLIERKKLQKMHTATS